MGLRLACSTIFRLVTIVILIVVIGLTAAGAGTTCVFRGSIGSSSAEVDCPNKLEKQFKDLDIGRWKQIADDGNGGERLYGQFVIFALEIVIALVIACVVVISAASEKMIKFMETCIMSSLAILTLGCAAAEAWYASGFGVLDSGSSTAWVDFTIISWALASAGLFVAGIILLVDGCLSCCGNQKYYGYK